jgi:hypothetical protein
MPPRPKPQQQDENPAQQLFDEFMNGFRRSRPGNLWREWDGYRVTVFQRKGEDTYSWVISCDDEDYKYQKFSSVKFDDEYEAMTSLAGEFDL